VFGEGAENNSKSIDPHNRETKIRQILNRRQQRFTGLRTALADKNRTAFVIVLAAERLPVLETIELYQRLKKTGVDIGALIVNKRLPKGGNSFMEERRRQENIHLDTLTNALPNVPRQDLELVAQDVVGLNALKAFAQKL
jgi:arsenite-transporting ATPase